MHWTTGWCATIRQSHSADRDYVVTKGYADSREFEKFPDISDVLNTRKSELVDLSDSRHEIYKSELANMLDGCLHIPSALAKKGLINMPNGSSDDEVMNVAKNTRNSIYEKLVEKKDRKYLPAFHIPAAIMASFWRDKKRKFNATDWLDFQHAETAIPYCDAFFTEKSLCHLAIRSDRRLDQEYGCVILSAIDDAIEYLIRDKV